MNTVRETSQQNLFSKYSQSCFEHAMGFTLIELMIVIAIIVIILTLGLPIYSNYTIRAKVGEALSIGTTAKTAIAELCKSVHSIESLNNARAGYSFEDLLYINSIDISGLCIAPLITITTQNTGATTDPVLLLTGEFNHDSDEFSWVCTTINGQNNLLPDSCRN